MFGLVAVLMFASPQDAARPVEVEAVVDDVVVVAGRGAETMDAFSVFEDYCFDANRLRRRADTPEDDVLWVPLQFDDRATLGLASDTTRAFKLETETLTLVLKVDEGPEGRVIRNQCALIIAGNHDQDGLVRRMAGLFSAAGTQKHVGVVEGYEPIPNWEQWAWTAIPHKRTSQWRGFSAGIGNDGVGYVVVAQPSFYSTTSHVIGNLKYSAEGPVPVSELTLTYRFRP